MEINEKAEAKSKNTKPNYPDSVVSVKVPNVWLKRKNTPAGCFCGQHKKSPLRIVTGFACSRQAKRISSGPSGTYSWDWHGQS
jgi:hypothetical protein